MQYMLPLIFLSDDTDKQNEFVDRLIKKEQYLPYYTYKIQPTKSEFGIDQIRAVKKEVITANPHKRIFILYLFDTASLEAQNAFLKTLEEKNENNQFVLLVSDIGRVLPTILSRSKILSPEDKNKPKEMNSSVVAIVSKIENKKDLSFLQDVSAIKREDAIALFDQLILVLKDQLSSEIRSVPLILKKALQQKALLVNNNLNPQLAVDSFFLFFRKNS